MNKMYALIAILFLTQFAFAEEALDDNRGCATIVIALVKVKAGTQEAFKSAALEILAPTRQEEGNLTYTFHQSTSDSTVFDTFERWKSPEDLDKHLQTPHMTEFFAKVKNFFRPGYPKIHVLKNIECGQ